MRREKTIHLNWSQTSNPNTLNNYLGCLEESKNPALVRRNRVFVRLEGLEPPTF